MRNHGDEVALRLARGRLGGQRVAQFAYHCGAGRNLSGQFGGARRDLRFQHGIERGLFRQFRQLRLVVSPGDIHADCQHVQQRGGGGGVFAQRARREPSQIDQMARHHGKVEQAKGDQEIPCRTMPLQCQTNARGRQEHHARKHDHLRRPDSGAEAAEQDQQRASDPA